MNNCLGFKTVCACFVSCVKNMLGKTLRKLGCCGVLVWMAIGAIFATFFIGEYMERPEEEKSVWLAASTVSFDLSKDQ